MWVNLRSVYTIQMGICKEPVWARLLNTMIVIHRHPEPSLLASQQLLQRVITLWQRGQQVHRFLAAVAQASL